jgi:2-phosphosulfolactate phosphatase
VQVHVAFTPAEEAAARVGIVVDVIRATSSIAQALAAGYERVLCCAEIDEAKALRAQLGDEAVVAEAPKAKTLILTTTNGTRTILTAVARCEVVLLGSLLNLSSLVAAVRKAGGDVAIICSGFKGAFALDDAYCAGRIVAELGGERSDAAIAAEVLAQAWPTPLDGLNARTYGPPGLEADIEFCAQVDRLDTVPRFARMVGSAAEIVA